MAQPYFSVIIPTLNEEKYLPHLLSDLADQTYRDFEVIIVDGKSNDNTIAWAEKYKSKLPLMTILTSKHRHVSTQRNRGAESSQGTYLIFMDADNRLPSYFLEGIHYRIMVEHPDLFTTWCSDDKSLPIGKTVATALNLMVDVAKTVEFEGALGALIGCKKTAFKLDKGFDTAIGYAEDGEFIRRYKQHGLSFIIFHDPQFVYSLRRFKTKGTLKTLQQTARLYIKQVTGKRILRSEYPMGGHVFIKSRKTLKESLKEIQSQLKVLDD